jgi:hypothetical protein
VPHDVADDEDRAAVGLEERVVPVAPDLRLLRRCDVPDGDLGLVVLRGVGEQATLQPDSEVALLGVQRQCVQRDAGTAARHELERLFGAKVYLETTVKVDKEWQRRAHALDRLGL